MKKYIKICSNVWEFDKLNFNLKSKTPIFKNIKLKIDDNLANFSIFLTEISQFFV